MAETVTHSPAPWTFALENQQLAVRDAESTVILVCDLRESPSDPHDNANFRLIAAAPDLLQACRDVLELFPEGDLDYRAPRLCRRLKVAIAKAVQS